MGSLTKKQFVEEVEKSMVSCQICGHSGYSLVVHIKTAHQMSPVDYAKNYPESRVTSPIIAHFMQRFRRNPLDGPIDSYLSNFKFLPTGNSKLIEQYRLDIGEYECPEELAHLIPEEDPHYSFQETALRSLIASMKLQKNIFFSGPTGCGKTQLILQLFNRLGKPINRINMDASVTPSTFIGRRSLNNGSTDYEYGLLPLAMKYGYPMLIDEIDFTPPPIASRLFPVLESQNPTLVIPETNEVIKAAPGFMVFGTGNTGGRGDMFGQYAGAEVQNIAYLGRFSMNVEMGYLDRKIEIDMLSTRYKSIPPSSIECMVDCANEMRTAFVNNDLNTPMSTRKMVELFDILPLLGTEEGLKHTIINWYGEESEKSLIEEIFSRKNLRENLKKVFDDGK